MISFLFSFLLDVHGLTNKELVKEAFEQTQQSLLQYCLQYYPQVAVRNRIDLVLIDFLLSQM